MNPNNLEKNLSQLKFVSLTSDEREVLRFKIDTAIKNKAYIVESPSKTNFSFIKMLGAMGMPAFLFLITFVSAAGSLPGDSTYSIKTNLNEPLQRLATFGEDNKLEFEKKLIIKRVDEAKKLKNKGLLDVVVAKDIEAQINKQANVIIQKSEKKALDNQDDSDAQKGDEAIALAEIKGTVAGGIGAVKVLSGQVISSPEDVNIDEPTDPIRQPSLENATESDEVKVVLPSVKKTIIQAEAQATTAKAKALKEAVITEEGESATVTNESIEIEAFTATKLNRAIETAEKSTNAVNEEELVKAVEDSTAVIVLTEALRNTK